jgi:hypothetical protein
MIGRLRQVVPLWVVGTFAALYLCLEGPVLYYEHRFGRQFLDLKVRPGTALLYIATRLYGIHRAVAFHPVYREDYRKWLELTPWTVQKPLPLGPIALYWSDGIVLGLLILLSATQPQFLSIRILNTFLIFHSIFLAGSFWATGLPMLGYLAVFGLALAFRLWLHPWFCFGAAVAVYLLAYEGLWRSLARFPWNLKPVRTAPIDPLDQSSNCCGWPYDRFCREVSSESLPSLGRTDLLLISLLIGWSAFGLEGLISDPVIRSRPLVFALALGIPLCLFGRLVGYLKGYRSPLSFWGRLCTGNWIIPGYDQALISPILIVLAPAGFLLACNPSSTPLEISLPVTLSLLALVTLLTPPSLKRWRLTGRHRICPDGEAECKKNGLVQVS